MFIFIYQWYVTKDDHDTFVLYRDVSIGSHTMRSGMNLVMFQEQDGQRKWFNGQFDIGFMI